MPRSNKKSIKKGKPHDKSAYRGAQC